MAGYAIRTRFGKDIIGEFLPPKRATKKQCLIIIASGAPSSPSKRTLLKFFSDKGFWAVHFRYRGTWESNGKFLAISPDKDIFVVMEQLQTGVNDLWAGKKYKVKPDQTIVLAGSFGGPAGIIAGLDKRIDRVICISPVIDWQAKSIDEPLDKFFRFIDQGYGPAFRVSKDAYRKLNSGKFYNPVNYTSKVDPEKYMIIHAKDDKTCLYRETKKFSNNTGIKLITLSKGGHLGNELITKPRFYKIFKKFVDQK